ncbi:uncharacterized protein TM35_000322010 [Trypanosoma theileri]|uniref:Uncharacterized protein n=1 Tax=Trypanosoma theileri TaxID=67003 RepID=A0A1X0NME8_9TRYP|nr:uncharacterized protein TM35_000322010 [Trypanosoma theileri]ORC85886.1 hypothetical protein TM35_000322010 [Trypanosoma theileri]
MLIKLICDDSCGFVKRLGASEIRVGWVVDENVPLQDASQITSLNAAIEKSHQEGSGGRRNSKNSEDEENNNSSSSNNNNRVNHIETSAMENNKEVVDFKRYAVTFPSSTEPLDVRRTPQALGLRSGVTLQLIYMGEEMTLQEPFSPIMTSPLRGKTQDSQVMNTEDDTDEDPEESYASYEIGWFPFLLRPREGEPLVLINDPFKAVSESDAVPATQPLCESCGALVSHSDALRVSVDRHYRPTRMRQDFMEVCMEKLGGGPIPRWQTRYVQISETSVDWFAEKPRPGVKCRIHGHRYIVRNGVCEVTALLENVDASHNPHCGDRNLFHFAIEFREPRRTYWFRVTTAQRRAAVVAFLQAAIRRAARRAPPQNPRVWKSRADAFLATAAQLGELHAVNRIDMDALRDRIETRQRELAELMQSEEEEEEEEGEKEKEEKKKGRGLQAALAAQTDVLQALRAELNAYEADTQRAQQRLIAAEARLTHETELLNAQRLEMGDEIHKVNMLKSYAMQQRDAAEKRIAELRQRAAALQAEEHSIFRKWRAFEERHRQPQHQQHDGKPHTRLYSFSEDGVGVSCGSPRLSTELAAAAAARIALSRTTPSRHLHNNNNNRNDSQTPMQSPQRPLQYSTSRERTP